MSRQFCYICLLEEEDPQDANFALTSIGGTAVCYEHIRRVGNSDILIGKPVRDWEPKFGSEWHD